MSCSATSCIFEKAASEDTLFDFDLRYLRELVDDDNDALASGTLSYTVVAPGNGTITLGEPAFSGKIVQFRCSGGTNGEDYQIFFSGVTDGGLTLAADAVMKVRKRKCAA